LDGPVGVPSTAMCPSLSGTAAMRNRARKGTLPCAARPREPQALGDEMASWSTRVCPEDLRTSDAPGPFGRTLRALPARSMTAPSLQRETLRSQLGIASHDHPQRAHRPEQVPGCAQGGAIYPRGQLAGLWEHPRAVFRLPTKAGPSLCADPGDRSAPRDWLPIPPPGSNHSIRSPEAISCGLSIGRPIPGLGREFRSPVRNRRESRLPSWRPHPLAQALRLARSIRQVDLRPTSSPRREPAEPGAIGRVRAFVAS
jgi:hypothetical protein